MAIVLSNKTIFTRYITPGSFESRPLHVEIRLTKTENKECLSLTGRCRGNYGQISYFLTNCKPYIGFDQSDVETIRQYWDRWHLNDMRAGTPRQEDFLRPYRGNGLSYHETCELLKTANLLYDGAYKYGSSCLYEAVPDDVLRYLFSLPGEGDGWDDIRQPDDLNIDLLYQLLLN